MIVRVIGAIRPDAMSELIESIRLSVERSRVVIVDLTAVVSLEVDCADELIALRRACSLEGARVTFVNAPAALITALGPGRGEALIAVD